MTKLPISASTAPQPKTLPYNGRSVCRKSLVFSFTSFDRQHELFNLGDDLTKPRPMPEAWFLSLLDTLKEASTKTIEDLRTSPFELHRVKWENANAKKPEHDSQFEYLQFRLSKSKGRIIGFMLPAEMSINVFYVVWLDAHHNLTDSDGYGKAKAYARPLNDYEILENECERLRRERDELKKDLEELLDGT